MGSFDEWLRSIGLEQYSDTFHENNIDLDVVGSLDDSDLRELGVKLGDRKRLLAAGKELALADTSSTPRPTPLNNEAERRQLTVMFCDLLAPIYNWFTEGVDTKDLQEAKALLEEWAV